MISNAYAGGGSYEPQQQMIQRVVQACPKWESGALDGFLQWGRLNLPGFDWWLIMSALLGGSMLVIAFPPTRQVLKAVVEVVSTVWRKTARKK